MSPNGLILGAYLIAGVATMIYVNRNTPRPASSSDAAAHDFIMLLFWPAIILGVAAYKIAGWWERRRRG